MSEGRGKRGGKRVQRGRRAALAFASPEALAVSGALVASGRDALTRHWRDTIIRGYFNDGDMQGAPAANLPSVLEWLDADRWWPNIDESMEDAADVERMAAICTAAAMALPENATFEEALEAGWMTVCPPLLYAAGRLLAGQLDLLETVDVAGLTAGREASRNGEDRPKAAAEPVGWTSRLDGVSHAGNRTRQPAGAERKAVDKC
jgi:hypothetical protein